ncbi:MAG TPA: hypothetical protein VNC50_20405 [Planctomycetia bacterium]|nr:hypothetical protein [Planctomycetia bacterium]
MLRVLSAALAAGLALGCGGGASSPTASDPLLASVKRVRTQLEERLDSIGLAGEFMATHRSATERGLAHLFDEVPPLAVALAESAATTSHAAETAAIAKDAKRLVETAQRGPAAPERLKANAEALRDRVATLEQGLRTR